MQYKNHSIRVRLTSEERKMIEKKAEQSGLTISKLVLMAINKFYIPSYED